MIRLNFASDSSTPLLCGSAPPERLVPAPRATTGTPAAWQRLSTSTSCASFSGSATAAGNSRYIVSPSHSYGLVSSADVSSADGGIDHGEGSPPRATKSHRRWIVPSIIPHTAVACLADRCCPRALYTQS